MTASVITGTVRKGQSRRRAAVRAYKAPTTSGVVILDAQGVVAHTGVGPDQDVVAARKAHLGEVPVTVWPKILRDMCAERDIHVLYRHVPYRARHRGSR